MLDASANVQAATEVRCSVKPEARSRHSATILGSLLTIFCGYDGMKPHASDVYTLDVDDPRSMMAKGLEESAAAATKEGANKEGEKKEEEDDE